MSKGRRWENAKEMVGESGGRPLGCEVARALGVILVSRGHLETEAVHADLQAHFEAATGSDAVIVIMLVY